jgi:hypothetical protein
LVLAQKQATSKQASKHACKQASKQAKRLSLSHGGQYIVLCSCCAWIHHTCNKHSCCQITTISPYHHRCVYVCVCVCVSGADASCMWIHGAREWWWGDRAPQAFSLGFSNSAHSNLTYPHERSARLKTLRGFSEVSKEKIRENWKGDGMLYLCKYVVFAQKGLFDCEQSCKIRRTQALNASRGCAVIYVEILRFSCNQTGPTHPAAID